MKNIISILLFALVLFYPLTAQQAAQKPNLTFSVISDLQLKVHNKKSHQKVRAALQDLHKINPSTDLMIINGDSTGDGRMESYAKLAEILRQNPHPPKTFFTIGNHAFFKQDGNRAAIRRFLNFADVNRVYYKRKIKGYLFIFLGSKKWGPVNTATKDFAFLGQAQLDWLKKTLKTNANPNQPIFVFLHQQLPNTFHRTSGAVFQSKALKNILNKYPRVILFSSHTHNDLRLPGMFVQEKFTMVQTGAVKYIVGPVSEGGGESINRNGSQGLYIRVYDNKVVIKGRDFAKNQWIQSFNHIVKTP